MKIIEAKYHAIDSIEISLHDENIENDNVNISYDYAKTFLYSTVTP